MQTELILANPDADIGLVLAKKARRKARQIADATGKPVSVRDPITDQVVATEKPKRKAKPAKAKANGKTPHKVAHRADGPEGKAAKVLALASRPDGASRAELIKLTGWKQQAWKWGFENSKGTGWCQRHGYKLSVIERKDGVTAYRVVKK